MTTPLWVVETAEEFWSEVGELESFPRDLRRPIAQGFPIAVVLLPLLTVRKIEEWLERQHILYHIGTQDRGLCACLVARFGQAIIFLDGTDPDDEQRFSIAHELAHFLMHYWRPRRDAVHHLGTEILEVLDGVRLARVDERIHALISRIDVGFHVHLIERFELGDPTSSTIVAAENDADRLALELLAPCASVTREIGQLPRNGRQDAAIQLLQDVYGFPTQQAARYSKILIPVPDSSDSLVHRLGLRP